MDLKPCTACGRQISPAAVTCPGCGHPIKPAIAPPATAAPSTGCGTLLLGIAAIFTALLVVVNIIPDKTHDRDDAAWASPNQESITPRDSRWEKVGSQGIIHFVRIARDQVGDASVFRQAYIESCAGTRLCQVKYWTSDASIPTRLPMSQQQADSMIASYVLNRSTGVDRLSFKCTLRKEPDCF